MIKIISVSALSLQAGITRSRVYQLIEGQRIHPDFEALNPDGSRAYFFKPKTAELLAGKIREQKDLPKRTRRKYD